MLQTLRKVLMFIFRSPESCIPANRLEDHLPLRCCLQVHAVVFNQIEYTL